jgi:pimeloyl-ACP methyl ester carboxylesterase
MPLGTFTLTIGGERQDGTAETKAKLHLRSQGVDTLIDPDVDEFKFPTQFADGRGVNISLPYSIDLYTDTAAGEGESTTIGYEGWVRTDTGRVDFQIAAQEAGATVALTDLTDQVVVPISTAQQYVTEAETAATEAVAAQAAAEAAAASVPSEAELSATYAGASFAPTVAQRDRRGQADRELSRNRSVVDFAAATEVVEPWTALTAWYNAGVQVSAGKLYSAAGASHSAEYPTNLNQPFRVKTQMQYVSGGAGLMFFGVVADSGTGIAPASGKLIGIGIDVGTGKMMSWNRGTRVDAAGTASPGSFLVTVIGDATSITLTLTSSTGFIEHRLRVLRSTFVSCEGFGLWHSDNALTAGSYIGPVVAKIGAKVTPTDRRVEILGPTVEWNPVGTSAQNVHIATPPTYDTRIPRPMLLFSHGSGSDELQPLSHFQQLYTDLLSDGFAIASTNAHGNNWGNAAAQTDLLELYRYLRDTYALGPLILWGNSMGGLASLNALASGAIPCAGWIGTQPVCDLDAIYAAGAFVTDIRTAYGVNGTGSDYAAKTAGFNPMARSGREFYGVPMRFYASPADTVVAKAQHTDPMAAKVAPYTPEATVIATSGDHGDPSHWAPQRADLRAFINRCVAS